MTVEAGTCVIMVARSTSSSIEGGTLQAVREVTPAGYILIGERRFYGQGFPYKEFVRRDRPLARFEFFLVPDTVPNRMRYNIAPALQKQRRAG